MLRCSYGNACQLQYRSNAPRRNAPPRRPVVVNYINNQEAVARATDARKRLEISKLDSEIASTMVEIFPTWAELTLMGNDITDIKVQVNKLATQEEVAKLNEEVAKLATKEEVAKLMAMMLATKEEVAKLARMLATKDEFAKLATKQDVNLDWSMVFGSMVFSMVFMVFGMIIMAAPS